MQVIEINGMKMEVDMRYAKRVDQFRVGDRVRLLTKKTSYNSAKILNGVIAGFEPFQDLPTIIVATIENGYGEPALNFHYVNSDSAEIELIPAVDDFLPIEKADIVSKYNKAIEEAKRQVEDVERKKAYFLNNFSLYFPQIETVEKSD
jgi:hypothetical protein